MVLAWLVASALASPYDIQVGEKVSQHQGYHKVKTVSSPDPFFCKPQTLGLVDGWVCTDRHKGRAVGYAWWMAGYVSTKYETSLPAKTVSDPLGTAMLDYTQIVGTFMEEGYTFSGQGETDTSMILELCKEDDCQYLTLQIIPPDNVVIVASKVK